jgi:alkylated DNA nucleotide flippase Atl1
MVDTFAEARGNGFRASSLYVKSGSGQPMEFTEQLDLTCQEVNPRHITVIHAESLREVGLQAAAVRVNIALEGGSANLLGSGSELTFGNLRIRITFACEPCSHGARLAMAPMRIFRRLKRYCGIILDDGFISLRNPQAGFVPHRYPAAPEAFMERCLWAARQIPSGHVVSSLQFLTAIGASSSYARVLPRWLAAASQADAPIHRILTSKLANPSWCPNALERLDDEGLARSGLHLHRFDLARHLWLG